MFTALHGLSWFESPWFGMYGFWVILTGILSRGFFRDIVKEARDKHSPYPGDGLEVGYIFIALFPVVNVVVGALFSVLLVTSIITRGAKFLLGVTEDG